MKYFYSQSSVSKFLIIQNSIIIFYKKMVNFDIDV